MIDSFQTESLRGQMAALYIWKVLLWEFILFGGEGNGNPFQHSCLGSPMDRGAWWATVHGLQRVRHDPAVKLQEQPCLERLKDSSLVLSRKPMLRFLLHHPLSVISGDEASPLRRPSLARQEIESEVFRLSSRNAWGPTSFNAMGADPSDFVSFIFLFDSYLAVV